MTGTSAHAQRVSDRHPASAPAERAINPRPFMELRRPRDFVRRRISSAEIEWEALAMAKQWLPAWLLVAQNLHGLHSRGADRGHQRSNCRYDQHHENHSQGGRHIGG